MLQMILLAVSLSWDSFFVGIADGTFRLTGGSRLRLLLLFALCDSCGTGIGLWNANRSLPRLPAVSEALAAGATLLIVCGILWRLVGQRGRAVTRMVYLAPLMLCVDNVVAGPATSHTGIPPLLCVALVGAASGLLFLLGALVGGCCHSWLRSRPSPNFACFEISSR